MYEKYTLWKIYEELTIQVFWPGQVDDSVANLSIFTQLAKMMPKALEMSPFLEGDRGTNKLIHPPFYTHTTTAKTHSLAEW